MSAITLGWIYGEMFDIVEFAEIPIGNESYRSIMMENNIVIEVRSAIGVQTSSSKGRCSSGGKAAVINCSMYSYKNPSAVLMR